MDLPPSVSVDKIRDMGKDNMADGQLPYPSATTGRLRLRVWSVWTAQTELQCSFRPTRPRQLWLCPPGRLDRDRYRKRPRLLSGSRGRARAFQSGSNKARKPPAQSVLVQRQRRWPRSSTWDPASLSAMAADDSATAATTALTHPLPLKIAC